MAESTKRLTTEEIWATALAVIGGLAVLLPLIVFAVGSQNSGDAGNGAAAAAVAPPPDVVSPGSPALGAGVERPRISEQPIPSSPSAMRKELVEARGQIDLLSDELVLAKMDAEASERSAKRAWIQLREAAGEPIDEAVEDPPVGASDPG